MDTKKNAFSISQIPYFANELTKSPHISYLAVEKEYLNASNVIVMSLTRENYFFTVLFAWFSVLIRCLKGYWASDFSNCYDNNLILRYQFGFRKLYTTFVVWLDLLTVSEDRLSLWQQLLTYLLIYTRDFDIVNREILLHKLDSYWDRGNTNNFFKWQWPIYCI